MIEAKVTSTASRTLRASVFLKNQLRRSVRLERGLEKKSITLKTKLLKDRDRTLKALLSSSTEERKDKKGVVGTLGMLGGGLLGRRFLGRGGGGGLVRGLKPRVPNTPSQLLRMRGGTSTLSRVGRFGKLGKVGPLAVIGTGLDFAGRRAEGQTNLQAGVGAGGGLAGALAGAKAGAVLGTAFGGPIGTVVGGVGGSIIGSLAGGRLADLFTGADRRRKFEEQRAIISSEKTLFSKALDDFDRVLDKFEDSELLLAIRKIKRDDSKDVRIFARPKIGFPDSGQRVRNFLQRPDVQIIGYGLLTAGLLVLGGPSGEEAIPAAGLMNAMNQTRAGAFLIRKVPILKKLYLKATKGQTFKGELVPGIDIPGISAKGIRIRAEALLKKINPNIVDDVVPPKTTPKFKRIETNVKDSDIQDLIKKGNMRELQELIKKGKTKIDGKKFRSNVERGSGDGLKIEKKNIKETPNTSKNIEEFNLFDNEIFKNLKNLKDLSDAGGSGNNIAMAGDTTVIVQEGNTQSSGPTVVNIGDITIAGRSSSNSFETIPKYVEMTQLFTT